MKQPANTGDESPSAARDQMKQAPGFCGGASFQPTGQLTVLAPAQFGADGKLTGGAWAERVEANGMRPGARAQRPHGGAPGQPAADSSP